MTLVQRVDDFGRPAWIAAVVISFVMFWPVGLILLGFLIGSGRIMGCWTNRTREDRWQRHADRMQQRGADRWQQGIDRMQQGLERMQRAADRWRGNGSDNRGGWSNAPSSGNHAFDEYRAETLRRLEDEQREFLGFLERLRHAKDKAEFDQFMAERRPPAGGATPPPPPQQ
jgi:hypothetical protein